MNDDILVHKLCGAVRGSVEADASLAPHTTMKVGGPAAALVTAERREDLVAVARICEETGRPWLIVGRGSNLLVADSGWRGVAVVLGTAFRGVHIDGHCVIAGAAEPMPALAHAVAKAKLGGLTFGVAIPGTVGGAVRMNAGAHGNDTSDVLEWANVARLSDQGRLQRLTRDELQMSYRHTQLPDDAVVVEAAFLLRPASQEQLSDDMREMQQWRRDHQPLSEPSCGSVFRNPPGDSAGRLIDTAGLKHHRVGGASVSTKHANFITVDPTGTATDVATLIAQVRREVLTVHGVDLTPEVVMVGFSGLPESGPGDDAASRSRSDHP